MYAWFQSMLRKFSSPNTGDLGESAAAKFLINTTGCRILARNWRSPRDRRDELDLIATDGEVLVFVEVKTRAKEAKVPGYYAVDQRKKRVVQRAARAYISRLREKPRTIRFDIVEVELPARGTEAEPVVRHFENVPLFPKDFRPDGS